MALVQVVDNTPGTDTTSQSVTVSSTKGNTLVLIIVANEFYGAVTWTVSDSASNTWTKAADVTSGTGGAFPHLEVWYTQSAAAVTSVTASTGAGVTATSAASVLEFSACGSFLNAATGADATTTSWSQTFAPAGLAGCQTMFVGAMGVDTVSATLGQVTGSTLTAFTAIAKAYNGTNHSAGLQYSYAIGNAGSGSLTGNWTQGGVNTFHHVTAAIAFPNIGPPTVAVVSQSAIYTSNW